MSTLTKKGRYKSLYKVSNATRWLIYIYDIIYGYKLLTTCVIKLKFLNCLNTKKKVPLSLYTGDTGY